MTVSRRSRRWCRRCLRSKSGRLDRRLLPDDHRSSFLRCPPNQQSQGCCPGRHFCCLGYCRPNCHPPPIRTLIRSSMRTDCPAHHPWMLASANLAAAATRRCQGWSSRQPIPIHLTGIRPPGSHPVDCLPSHPAVHPAGLQSGRQFALRPIARLIALPIGSHPVTTSRRRMTRIRPRRRVDRNCRTMATRMANPACHSALSWNWS